MVMPNRVQMLSCCVKVINMRLIYECVWLAWHKSAAAGGDTRLSTLLLVDYEAAFTAAGV